MNLVDSSAWLEYFAAGTNARHFAKVIEDSARLIVPTLCIFEVFKRVLVQRSEDDGLRAVAFMERGRIVDLDRATALSAVRVSVDHGLPMADGVIYATAVSYGAALWTQDADFDGLKGVRYFPRTPA